jgi:hypothetical protein
MLLRLQELAVPLEEHFRFDNGDDPGESVA